MLWHLTKHKDGFTCIVVDDNDEVASGNMFRRPSGVIQVEAARSSESWCPTTTKKTATLIVLLRPPPLFLCGSTILEEPWLRHITSSVRHSFI
jgi:hypothetical protein